MPRSQVAVAQLLAWTKAKKHGTHFWLVNKNGSSSGKDPESKYIYIWKEQVLKITGLQQRTCDMGVSFVHCICFMTQGPQPETWSHHPEKSSNQSFMLQRFHLRGSRCFFLKVRVYIITYIYIQKMRWNKYVYIYIERERNIYHKQSHTYNHIVTTIQKLSLTLYIKVFLFSIHSIPILKTNQPTNQSKKSPTGSTFHGPRTKPDYPNSSIATSSSGSVGIRYHSIFGGNQTRFESFETNLLQASNVAATKPCFAASKAWFLGERTDPVGRF